MILPKGNVLIEKVILPFADINIMLNNLEQQGFTGYVLLEMYKTYGAVFFSHGEIIRAAEIEDSKARVCKLARVLNKVKNKEVAVSSYVLSPQIVSVIASLFAFEPLYLDYEVKKKEFKKVLSILEADNISGILEIMTRDTSTYLLIDHGKIIMDSFAKEYGQILCGMEGVNHFLETIFREGGRINVFAERAEIIESKKKAAQEEIEMEKQLIARPEGGYFKSAETVKVDEYIIREWGLKTTATLNVELEAPDGHVYNLKCSAGKKLGGYVAFTVAMMKRLKIREGDLVNVKPVL